MCTVPGTHSAGGGFSPGVLAGFPACIFRMGWPRSKDRGAVGGLAEGDENATDLREISDQHSNFMEGNSKSALEKSTTTLTPLHNTTHHH